jgi:hypothetical protein
MKTKLKRYSKEEVLAYWRKLLADRKTRKVAQSALMEWVDSGPYTISKP